MGNVGIKNCVKYLNHFKILCPVVPFASSIDKPVATSASLNIPLMTDLKGESVALASCS
jgi:hypothetical protein